MHHLASADLIRMEKITLVELVDDIKRSDVEHIRSVFENCSQVLSQKNLIILFKAAVEVSSEDIIIFLLNSGIQKNAALDIAIHNGNENAITLILDRGADVNEGLYFAVKAENMNVVTLLLKRGADINTNVRNGNTPLHAAVLKTCSSDFVAFLIANGADCNARTKDKTTASDIVKTFLTRKNDSTTKEKLETIEHMLDQKCTCDREVKVIQGLPNRLSGDTYQIKFLTLYAVIYTRLANSDNITYELGTEVMDLVPFDDIYLRETRNGITHCRFVQIKQTKKPELNKIEQSNFFTILKPDKFTKTYLKGNDTIVKMVIKFIEIADSYSENDTVLGEFIFCTNTDFRPVSDSLNIFREVNTGKKDYLSGFGAKKWKIHDWHYLYIEVIFVLLNFIGASPYMANEIKNKVKFDTLLEKIDKIKTERMNAEYLVEITSCYVSTIANEALIAIEQCLNVLEASKMAINRASEVELIKKNFPKEWELPLHTEDTAIPAFRKSAVIKITEIIQSVRSDIEIFLHFKTFNLKKKVENFANNFSIYTNCPNTNKLDEIITKEISEEFHSYNSKLLAHHCVQHFTKWVSDFTNGRANLFTDRDGKKLFRDMFGLIFNGLNKPYLEDLKTLDIQFKHENQKVLNFLNNENAKVIHVITDHPRLHAIHILQTLKTFEDRPNNMTFFEKIIFTSSEHIFKSNEMLSMLLNAFSTNESNDFLIIECLDDSPESESLCRFFNELRLIIMENTSKKVIIIARDHDQLAIGLKYIIKEYDSHHVCIGFKDLTRESQEMILDRTVNFQNDPNSSRTDIELKNLLTFSSACEVIDEDVLSTIVTNREGITIGNADAFHSNEYNTKYYIPRRILFTDIKILNNCYQCLFFVTGITKEELINKVHELKNEIHYWEEGKHFNFGITLMPHSDDIQPTKTSEEVFDLISNKFVKSFWLEFKEDLLFRRDTKNDNENNELFEQMLDKYSVPPEDLDQKVVIVANHPGEGKSTVLTHLAHAKKKTTPNSWIIRLDLKNYTENKSPMSLKDLTFSVEDTSKAVQAVALMAIQGEDSNINIKLERMLLCSALSGSVRVEVILLFDGFDEISPDYKENCYTLIKALTKCKVRQIWITTRVHMKEYLEEQLQVPACTLAALTEEEQAQFLSIFWKSKLVYSEPNFPYPPVQTDYDTIDYDTWSYAETSIESWKYLIRDGGNFLKVPLNLVMFAEIFTGKWNISNNNKNTQLFEIYQEFVNYKFKIYEDNKSANESGNQANKDRGNVADISFREMHREVAVKTLFPKVIDLPEYHLPELNICCKHPNICEGLTRIGLLKYNGNRVEFIHHSYAEYFFSEYITIHLKNPHVQLQFLANILVDKEYDLVRKFFDAFLRSRSQSLYQCESNNYLDGDQSLYPFKDVLVPEVFKDTKIQNNNDNVLHITARDGYAHIYLFILNNMTYNSYIDLVMKSNKNNMNVLHLAAKNCHSEIYSIIVDSFPKRPDVIKLLLMTTTDEGYTSLHIAVVYSKGKICATILKTVKKHVDIFKDFVTAEGRYGSTALHLAVHQSNLVDVKSFIDIKTYNADIFKVLIMKRDVFGQSVLHMATLHPICERRRIICDLLIKATEEYPDALKTLLTAVDSNEQTALHLVSKHDEALCKSILGTCKQNPEILKQLITKRDKDKRNCLYFAAFCRRYDICDLILTTAGEYPGIVEYLIENSDNNKVNIFHVAACRGDLMICELILKTAKQYPDLFKRVISKCDNYMETALHIAAWNNYGEICEIILQTATEYPNVFKELVIKSDRNKRTALHLAVLRRHMTVCDVIIKAACVYPNVFKALILSSDTDKKTVLHVAACKNYADVCKLILEHAKNYTDLLKGLLLKCDTNNQTALHIAACKNYATVCKLIIDPAKNNTVLLRDMLLKSDTNKQTALHVAACKNYANVCELIIETAKINTITLRGILLKCDTNKQTALHVAASKKYANVCKLIIEPAKINTVLLRVILLKCDTNKQTALHIAASKNDADVCELIIETAKINTVTLRGILLKCDTNKQTALHVAASKKHANVCKLIIEPAKINTVLLRVILLKCDTNKQTALHIAAIKNDADVCELIIEAAKNHTEILRGLLLKCDKNKQTLFNVVVRRTDSKVCDIITGTYRQYHDISFALIAKYLRHTPERPIPLKAFFCNNFVEGYGRLD